MKGKVCVVTGSTSGIGKAIATELARQGAHVVMAGHDREQGERARDEVAAATGRTDLELEIADFSTMDAVRAFAAAVGSRHETIDVLVNNAGLLCERPVLTADGLEQTWAVNYFAPFLLTHLLLDRLAAAPQGRIVNTASVAHRWGRLDRGPRPPKRGVLSYFDSKLALVVFTRRLAARLAAPVTCNCFHPGVIGTDIAGGTGTIGRLVRMARPLMKRPEHGARGALHLVTAPELATATGGYFVGERPGRVSRKAHDDRAAEALWARSVELTGVGE